jgi:hypothetical protein
MLLIVAALVALAGVALFIDKAPAVLDFALNPQARLLDAPGILQSLMMMVLGAALTIAGLIGIWWALWPSTGQRPGSRPLRSAGRRQKKHQGDHNDTGLWLDTGSADDQETGIRLF